MKKTFLVAVSCRRWWFSSCWRSQAGSAVSSNAMSAWSSFPPTRCAATGVGRCRSTAGSSIRRRIRFAAAPPRTSFGESLGLDEVPAQSDLFGERPPFIVDNERGKEILIRMADKRFKLDVSDTENGPLEFEVVAARGRHEAVCGHGASH